MLATSNTSASNLPNPIPTPEELDREVAEERKKYPHTFLEETYRKLRNSGTPRKDLTYDDYHIWR